MSIVQDANPEPPIIFIPRVRSGVHGRALLSARLVSDVLVEHPKVHINLQQIREEAADDVPLQERGWQEAVQAVSPLKVNLLRVVDAEVTYVDEAPFEPLHLSKAEPSGRKYPQYSIARWRVSFSIQMEAVIFDPGKLWLEGHADFLAYPMSPSKHNLGLSSGVSIYQTAWLGVTTSFLEGVPFQAQEASNTPLASKLHTCGRLPFAAFGWIISILGQPTDSEPRVPDRSRVRLKKSADHPAIMLRADEVSIVESELGFVNKKAKPNYRLFLTDLEIHLSNFSNQLAEGVMVARVSGKFMGSGQTVVGATFRPEINGPDFALAASIENTNMQTMNPLLRAHGNFDVVRGFFSVYTEMRVKNGAVQGYVKPLFKEMDVYDPHQDREKSLFQKIYEGLVGGVSQLLENSPRQEVATKADISGPS